MIAFHPLADPTLPAIIAITDALAENGAWLVAAEPVHRMLRPAIPTPTATTCTACSAKAPKWPF
jgi:hypothetical protein